MATMTTTRTRAVRIPAMAVCVRSLRICAGRLVSLPYIGPQNMPPNGLCGHKPTMITVWRLGSDYDEENPSDTTTEFTKGNLRLGTACIE